MPHTTTPQPKKKKNMMMGLVLVFLVIALGAVILTNIDLDQLIGGSEPVPVASKSSGADSTVPNLLSDETWKALLLYGDPIEPINPGRNNPFLPF